MTLEKAKRLVTSGVITAVILLCVLLTVMVFQLLCLNQKKKELDALVKTEEEYLQLQQETEDEIALWLEEWKIEEAARTYGFRKNGK